MADTCKSCGAPIVWIRTPAGKSMPCDAALVRYRYDPAGKCSVVTDIGTVVRCNLDFEGIPTGMARVPHWATCPQAEKFRRRRA